jgi:drug/metabolite transporter (DMT)-like permease
VYPLARGTAPLLAVAIGIVLLHETLGPIGFLGVGALLVGLLSLQRPWRYLQATGREGGGAAGFAILTGITIAAYSAVDRVGVRGTQPWIYAGLIWASGATFLWVYVWLYRRQAAARVAQGTVKAPAEISFSARRAAFGGLMTLGAYLMILFAFSVAPLTAVAPLRESAIVLASGWGSFRLREAADRPDALRRLAAAGLVVVGAILLALD